MKMQFGKLADVIQLSDYRKKQGIWADDEFLGSLKDLDFDEEVNLEDLQEVPITNEIELHDSYWKSFHDED